MTPEPIHKLMQAYFSGKATPEQLSDLEQWLCEDESHVREFVDLSLLDGMMLSEQKNEDAAALLATLREAEDNAEPEFSLLEAPAFDRPSREADPNALSAHDLAAVGGYALRLALTSKPAKRIYAYTAAAATILLAVVLFNPWGDNETPTDAPFASDNTSEPDRHGPAHATHVATLTAQHDATWAERALARGSELEPGQRLTLTAGFAEITTNDGAIAIIEAPATIQLINDNALYLHAGKLVGLCYTESSKGFVVKTDHAEVTDLGTEFGVEVSNHQFTATVLTGEIVVSTPGNQSKVLTDDQTATLSPKTSATLTIDQGLAKGFEELIPRVAQAHALRNDPAMIAYWGFEAGDIVDGKLLNRAIATQGKMNGTLGQEGKSDSAPTLTEGRLPGTNALRFEADEFDIIRVGIEDAKAIDGLDQFTIGLWVRPDHMDQESHHLLTKRMLDEDGKVHVALNAGLAWDGSGGGYQGNSVFFHSQRVDPGYRLAFKANALAREFRWMHVAVTFDRGERSLYIDGRFIEHLPASGADRLAASDAELLIGASMIELDDPGTYLDGDLDELFILGRVMPANEIQALYRSGVPAE